MKKTVSVIINIPDEYTYVIKTDDDGTIYHPEKDYYDLSVRYEYVEKNDKQITLDFELEPGETKKDFI